MLGVFVLLAVHQCELVAFVSFLPEITCCAAYMCVCSLSKLLLFLIFLSLLISMHGFVVLCFIFCSHFPLVTSHQHDTHETSINSILTKCSLLSVLSWTLSSFFSSFFYIVLRVLQ